MIEYTSPDVLRDSPDPADPTTIDWPERQARALIPFQIASNGHPVTPVLPMDDRPVRGRNGLWLWGENPMADALVTCTYAGRRWVLLVRRRDDQTWAMPGGSIEPGEVGLQAALRELKEETSLDLFSFMALNRNAVKIDMPRWVPDPRGSMEAWAVTVVARFDLGEVESLPEVRGGDDARDARWWCSVTDPGIMRRIFPAHREILAGAR